MRVCDSSAGPDWLSTAVVSEAALHESTRAVLRAMPRAFGEQLTAQPTVYVAMALMLQRNTDSVFARKDGLSFAQLVSNSLASKEAGEASAERGTKSLTAAMVDRITAISQPAFEGGAGLWAYCMARYMQCLAVSGVEGRAVAAAMRLHTLLVLAIAYSGVDTAAPVPGDAATGGPGAAFLEYDRLKRLALGQTGDLEELPKFCHLTWARAMSTAREARSNASGAAPVGAGTYHAAGGRSSRAAAARPTQEPRGPPPGERAMRAPAGAAARGGVARAAGAGDLGGARTEQVCYQFQSRAGCARSSCRYGHRCIRCGSDAHGEATHQDQAGAAGAAEEPSG